MPALLPSAKARLTQSLQGRHTHDFAGPWLDDDPVGCRRCDWRARTNRLSLADDYGWRRPFGACCNDRSHTIDHRFASAQPVHPRAIQVAINLAKQAARDTLSFTSEAEREAVPSPEIRSIDSHRSLGRYMAVSMSLSAAFLTTDVRSRIAHLTIDEEGEDIGVTVTDGVQTSDPHLPEDQLHNAPPARSWARGEAIQPMTTEVLIRRSLEFSSSGFTTIISIFQGVALGLLAQQAFEKRTTLVAFQSAALLMVFFVVFYFYMTLSILLRWAPSFLDAFLPFAFGGLEIPPAFFLGNATLWSAWLAAFWSFTSLGVLITIKWTPPSHFGGDLIAHRMMHRLLWELQIVTAGGGLLSGAASAVTTMVPNGTAPAAAGVCVILATVCGVVAAIEKHAARIHCYYGVNRPAFN